MHKKRIVIVFVSVIVALIVLFVFGNSLKSREESKKDSDAVVGIIGPIIEAICGREVENVGFIVRKMAHFAEFGVLGLAVSGLVAVVDYRQKWKFCGYGLLFCLFVAVCDEFIQNFTGRGSAVGDVLIDFSGAITGYFVMIALVEIIKFARNKKSYKKEKCQ